MPRNRLLEESDRNLRALPAWHGVHPSLRAHQQQQSMLLSKLPDEILHAIFVHFLGDMISLIVKRSDRCSPHQLTTRFHARQCVLPRQPFPTEYGLPGWVTAWAHGWPWPITWFDGNTTDLKCRCSAGAIIALLQTCQRIFRIAQPLLWRSTRFSIASVDGTTGTCLDFDPMGYSYNKVPPQRLPVQHIRYVNIAVAMHGVLDHALRAAVLRAVHLRELHLRFQDLERHYHYGPVVDRSLPHLFCRLQGLDDFSIRSLTDRANQAEFACDVEDSLQSTLKQLICNGGPRRTLSEGKELDRIVAQATELFGSVYEARLRRKRCTRNSCANPVASTHI